MLKGDSFMMCIINMTVAYNNGKMGSWKILLNVYVTFEFL